MGKGFSVNYRRNRSAKRIPSYTRQFHSLAALVMEKNTINFDTSESVLVGMTSGHGFMV